MVPLLLKDILIQTIGEYAPLYSNYAVDGVRTLIDKLDVPWILSAVLLIVLVWSAFKLVGGLLR